MSKSNDGWFCSTCLASIFPFNHFDNDIDFFYALFGFNAQGDFDTDLLKQKNFNLFFDDPETSHLLLNSNLDPDTNFFSANSELLSNCLYLTSTEFNKMPSLPPDTFSSLHINIRSLPKHFDDLSEFLLTLNRSFSVIAVSETWLHRSNSDLLHSLAFLCQHTINHFHLNHFTLSAAILRNPDLQKVSLYPGTGRIFSINNSKQTLLYLTNLDITSIEISSISY